MHVILDKLWASKGTIAIVLWVLALTLVYTLDYTKKPVIHNPVPAGKTIEEIIATPVDTVQEAPWDQDFKSAVEPM